jgi:hypothetical protein
MALPPYQISRNISSGSEAFSGGKKKDRHIDTQTDRETGDLINVLSFFGK